MFELPHRIVYIIKLTIAICFILIGIIAFIVRFKFEIPELNMILFSGLVVVYGIFRLYRAQKFLKEGEE